MTKGRPLLTAVLVASLCAGCQFGDPDAPAVHRPGDPRGSPGDRDGVVTGTVISVDGQPIEGAVLDFARVDGLPMNQMGLASLEDGSFERDLSPTTYQLTVRAEGYAEFTDEVRVDAGVRLVLEIVLRSD